MDIADATHLLPPADTPSNRALLDRLRGAGMPRPHVDPELAGGLREWLEDSLAGCAASVGRAGRVVRVDSQLLSASHPHGRLVQGPTPGAVDFARDDVLVSLVRCIFCQWVTTKNIGRRSGQPFLDAIDSLSVSGDPGGTVEAVNRLSPQRRKALSDEVTRHAANISATWPVLCPAWYPRTRERISIPLCGGRIRLDCVVDLVIGAQATEEATVCLVQVGTATTNPRANGAELHFNALLETLRAGAPPCRVARYATGSGELYVEPVDEHILVGALLETIEVTEKACAVMAEATIVEHNDSSANSKESANSRGSASSRGRPNSTGRAKR